MARNLATYKPSFYKILIDFTVELGLPIDFMRKYSGLVPEKAKLRIASGATWKVTVEKLEDSRYYFTRGWADFSREMGLQKAELLVFTYVGNDTFNVTVYAITAFEKMSNFSIVNNDDNSASSNSISISSNSGYNNSASSNSVSISKAAAASNFASSPSSSSCDNNSWNPRFSKKIGPGALYKLYVNKNFVDAAGLIRGESVRVEYPGGTSGEVVVGSAEIDGRNYLVFEKGWTAFARANGLTVGKTYSFERVSSPATKIKVVRVEPAAV